MISYQVSKQSLRQSLIDNELPLTSNNIFSEIQKDLLQPVLVASMMANDIFVKDWLHEGERKPEQMSRSLDETRERFSFFTSFLVSDTTLKCYHFSGLSQVISEDDPRDAWYSQVRNLDESHEIDVDINEEQNDTLTIFINFRRHWAEIRREMSE